MLKENLERNQVFSSFSKDSSSLDDDIEAILNDSYVVKSVHSNEEIKTKNSKKKR